MASRALLALCAARVVEGDGYSGCWVRLRRVYVLATQCCCRDTSLLCSWDCITSPKYPLNLTTPPLPLPLPPTPPTPPPPNASHRRSQSPSLGLHDVCPPPTTTHHHRPHIAPAQSSSNPADPTAIFASRCPPADTPCPIDRRRASSDQAISTPAACLLPVVTSLALALSLSLSAIVWPISPTLHHFSRTSPPLRPLHPTGQFHCPNPNRYRC
jgi:hypothetical protein